MIPAAFLCAMISGCADQELLGPSSALRVATDRSATMNRFFLAWSKNYSASPIQTQSFALDERQERQWSWWADEPTLNFARSHPGRLYIVGDEPDQACSSPGDYAIIYHDFVTGMKAVDPTARFSPSGFTEPNYKCCPGPDDVPNQCWYDKHSLGFAQDFYDAYVKRYGSPPPVNEWRFHDFALRYAQGDVAGWWGRIDQLASWSVAHGANMVLGAWGFHGWRSESMGAFQEQVKQAMGRLLNDSRINGAVWWSYESWAGEAHYLANDDGSLTDEGKLYANPMTDVPMNPIIITGADGQAKLSWNNSTYAWGAEVEVLLQPAGSTSFGSPTTVRMTAQAANETPFATFNKGDVVKGRVRYYNAYVAGPWSNYSSNVTIVNGKDPAPPTPPKIPLFCFFAKRIDVQTCN